MREFRGHLVTASFAVLLVGAIALVLPQRARSVYSSPVSVVNSSVNPVPTSDSSTRYQAAVCAVLGSVSTATALCPANQTTFVVPTTTAAGVPVKRLVVDNVSGFCSTFDNVANVIKAVRLRGQFTPDAEAHGISSFTHYVPMIGARYSYTNDPGAGYPYANHQETDYTYGQATHFAFNPGDTVNFEIWNFSTGVGTFDQFCIGRVEGYLMTQ